MRQAAVPRSELAPGAQVCRPVRRCETARHPHWNTERESPILSQSRLPTKGQRPADHEPEAG